MKRLITAFTALFMFSAVSAKAAETVTIYVGLGAGFERYASALAPYLGKHLPGNPTVVVKSMQGGGGTKMLNYLYSKAANDGTEIGIANSAAGYTQAYDHASIQYDVSKLKWIGSMDAWRDVYFVTSKSSGIDSVSKLKQGFKAGASGISGQFFQYAFITKNVLGITNAKVIPGYSGGLSEIIKAMSLKEVDSLAAPPLSSLLMSTPLSEINLIFHWDTERSKATPDVPTIFEITDKSKHAVLKYLIEYQAAVRPFVAPPGVSEKTLQALRKAFDETMKDPEFLANIERVNLSLKVTNGSDLQSLMKFISTGGGDPDLIKQASELLK